jgi:hypothetical protein
MSQILLLLPVVWGSHPKILCPDLCAEVFFLVPFLVGIVNEVAFFLSSFAIVI